MAAEVDPDTFGLCLSREKYGRKAPDRAPGKSQPVALLRQKFVAGGPTLLR